MKIKKITKKIKKSLNEFDPERLKKPFVLMALIFLMIMVLFIQDSNVNIKKETGFNLYSAKRIALKKKIKDLTKGYPIEKMAYYISQKDEATAGFLVAIAKKESNWGKRVPVLDGKDCFNYWGYRGIRDKMGSGGHTCFDSPRDAVATISKRLNYLIRENGIDTPRELAIWKCGRNCRSQNQEDVNKWIDDVALYYEKVIE